MARCSRRTLRAAGVLLILLGGAARPAFAGDLITEVTGQYTGIMPASGFLQPSFTLTNGTASTPPSLSGLAVGDLTVNVVMSPSVNLNPGLTPRFTIFGTMAGEMAVFDIINPGTVVQSGMVPGTGTITAGVTLMMNSIPSTDLSLFSGGGTLIVDYRGIAIMDAQDILILGVIPGSATWPFPPGTPVSATFRLIAGGVPEPSGLALAGTGLMALALARWRGRRSRRPDQPARR